MSFLRHAKQVDTTQKEIVDGLRRCGFCVEILGLPVDIAVRHHSWIPNAWVMLECKTPNRAGGKYKPRADQKDQADFCQAHEVPYITSLDHARAYLDVRGIELERR